MPQDYSNFNTNLEGINQFLNSNGVKLSDNDKQKLQSIFDTADGVYAKDNPASKDGRLDEKEMQYFKENVEKELPSILNKVKGYFEGIKAPRNMSRIQKEQLVAPADATRVDNSASRRFDLQLASPQALRPFSPNSSARAKNNVVYDNEVMNQALNNLLKNANSKLKNTAAAFLRSSQNTQNKLDPFVLIAISMHESGRGISKAALNKNNVGGIMGKGGLRKFANVESCIDSIAHTVNKRVTEGSDTIASIGRSGRYCDKKSAPEWIKEVTSFAESLRKEYNRLLAQKYKS